jgi:hypothetical protein
LSHKGEKRKVYWVLVRAHDRTGREHLESLKMDQRLISKWILQEQNWMAWTIHMAQDRDEWWALI